MYLKEVEKINKLIVVRHGSHKYDELDEYGIERSEKIGEMLSLVIGSGQSAVMRCSPINRAVKTAGIMSEQLNNLPFEKNKVLYEEAIEEPESNDELLDFPQTLKLVSELEEIYQIVILVTHLGSASCLPMYYAVHVLGLPQMPFNFVGMGEGQVLDCDSGSISYLSTTWEHIK